MDFDPKFNTYGILKLWALNGRYSVKDIGIGVGVGDGTWGSNCTPDSHSSDGEACQINKATEFGIPIQTSIVVGRYLGIGVSANAFLTQNRSHYSVSFSVPIGLFTRRN